ncbi:MAG: FAD-dependent oxidoreductase [Phycisphaerales bacterium]
MSEELSTQVLIIGGGTGGVAAALACGSRGISCIVTEPTPWIGGQLTSQAVPPDENQWVETFGATRRYQRFRELVRAWYREHRSLTPRAKDDPLLNPGNGWVSRLCFEPRVGHEVLESMLAPLVASGKVTVRRGLRPVGAEPAKDRVESVRFEGPDGPLTIRAPFIIDATELGDLYPLAGIEHAIGAEGRAAHGELHAHPGGDDPRDQQAFSWCFALSHHPGEDHTIPRPEAYAKWREYRPEMTPAWCGPLFSWLVPSHNDAGCRTLRLVPHPDEPGDEWELWRYRRIVDASIYAPGSDHPPDVCLVNWVQMDYWRRPLLGVSGAEQQTALREAREQSLCLLHWMQTEAPRHDGGVGYPGLALRGDELGTADGFAMAPYIREPRRLVARTIVHEGHIGTEQRKAEGRPHMDEAPFGRAEPFLDSVGIGHYTLDLHPSTSGRNSVYVPAAPFRIPLGSLIPVRCRNVIAGGKGIGVTHITNGCFRMHAVEWNIGEAAGALAAWCVANDAEPAEVHADPGATEEFQRDLVADGVRIAWPWESEAR